jgi:hypothetical protein
MAVRQQQHVQQQVLQGWHSKPVLLLLLVML